MLANIESRAAVETCADWPKFEAARRDIESPPSQKIRKAP